MLTWQQFCSVVTGYVLDVQLETAEDIVEGRKEKHLHPECVDSLVVCGEADRGYDTKGDRESSSQRAESPQGDDEDDSTILRKHYKFASIDQPIVF